MSDLPKLNTPEVYFRWVHANLLKVDQEAYQRRVKPKLVRRIIANFNPRALGTITVGERSNGDLYIEDGQQRWTAVTALDPEYELACLIFGASSTADEANDFVAVNHNRISLTWWELFRARLSSDDKAAPAIKAIIEQYGLTLRLGPGGLGDNEIACSAVLDLLHSRGHLPAVLSLVVSSWGRNYREAFTGYFLRSLDSFLMHYKLFGDKFLVEAMRDTTPEAIIYEGNKIATLYRTHRLERVLVSVYNEYVRHGHSSARLRDWDQQTKELREQAWMEGNVSQVVTLSPFMPARSRMKGSAR